MDKGKITDVSVSPSPYLTHVILAVGFFRSGYLGKVRHPGSASMVRLLRVLHGLGHLGRVNTSFTEYGYVHYVTPLEAKPCLSA